MTTDTRKIALNALHQVQRKGVSVDEAIPAGAPPLVRALVLTTLRHRGVIDALLKQFMKKPIDEQRAALVQDALRLGVAQLLWLDVPDYACLLYTSPSPRDRTRSRMPSSA